MCFPKSRSIPRNGLAGSQGVCILSLGRWCQTFPPVATPVYAPACLLAFSMCHDGVSNCKIYTCKEFWFSSTWNTHTHTRTGTPEPRHLNEDSMLYLDPA